MTGATAELSGVITIESADDNRIEDNDKGPCERQVFGPQDEVTELEEEASGCISGESTQIIHEGDQLLAKEIRRKSNNRILPRLNWPTRDIKPISEYSNTKIFCLAFPWLFPGGVGDIKEAHNFEVDIGDWTQNLLF